LSVVYSVYLAIIAHVFIFTVNVLKKLTKNEANFRNSPRCCQWTNSVIANSV